MMLRLSQRNPIWCSVKLGESQLTIGRFGCTTTCLAMLSSYFNCYMRPDEIAVVNSWYTNGLINWPELNFKKFVFVNRGYEEDTEVIKKAIADPKQAVILQVNNGQHWVVAIKPTLIGNDYIVVDPWNGGTCNAKAVYHNITGYALFKAV